MVANLKLVEPFYGRAFGLKPTILESLQHVQIFVFARIVSLGKDLPEPQKVLTDEGVLGLEGGVVELQQRVLSQVVEAHHLFLRQNLVWNIHRVLKLYLV